MKIEDAYLSFLTSVNRNLTNNNIDVSKPRFIILFNNLQIKYIEWILNSRNEDFIRYASTFLEDSKLSLKKEYKDRSLYSLPEDYFDLSNLSLSATKSDCGSKSLHTIEVKTEDLQELLNDKFNEPSFEYGETFYHVSGDNSITAYKKGFDITEATLKYYRYPKEVDIKGYKRADGTNSEDRHPEWDDKAVNRILLGAAREFAANNSDGQKYELTNNSLFSTM